ncbi:MAG: glycoside hydrolase family 43 protein [Spirochaetales bacterium]|nr:glycoside hydrolase family 43 protein [Spirochaetales bacterium]
MTQRTYTNPVISGSFPDPSVVRVGDDYYSVHSSFIYYPGVPVFHSKDLVNWRQIGYVLDRPSQMNLDGVRSNGGIYAPTIRYNKGTFYMITTNVDGIGNFYVTASDPAGPWSDPIVVEEDGIDPSLFFDDDGKIYYTQHVGLGDGFIGQAEIDIATGKLKEPLQNIWSGTGNQWPEGPHLYKAHGMYYLMIAEGGTSFGHMITVARSSSPMGPFESCPRNPVLTHKDDMSHPFQTIGHADLIETPDGWWSVCLGVRIANNHLGREMFLAPVEWIDGWPVINGGKHIEPVMTAPKLPQTPVKAPLVRDDFNKPELDIMWNYLRNPVAEHYSLTEKPGCLRLWGPENSLNEKASPAFVGRRQEHARAKFAAKLFFTPEAENEEAGLVVRCSDEYRLDLCIRGKNGAKEVFLRRVADGTGEELNSVELKGEGPVVLSIDAQPNEYRFFAEAEGTQPLFVGSSDALAYTYEKTQSFMGVVIGMYASGNGRKNANPADFDWFDYEGIEK